MRKRMIKLNLSDSLSRNSWQNKNASGINSVWRAFKTRVAYCAIVPCSWGRVKGGVLEGASFSHLAHQNSKQLKRRRKQERGRRGGKGGWIHTRVEVIRVHAFTAGHPCQIKPMMVQCRKDVTAGPTIFWPTILPLGSNWTKWHTKREQMAPWSPVSWEAYPSTHPANDHLRFNTLPTNPLNEQVLTTHSAARTLTER